MAVNEKAEYATGYISVGRRLVRPGEQLTGDPAAYANAREHGQVTSSHAEAQRAEAAERERRAHVDEQIATRSEQREHNQRRAGNIPQLVRMPDGSLREVSH